MAAFFEAHTNEVGGAFLVRVQEGPDGRYANYCIQDYGPHLFELPIQDPVNEARRAAERFRRYGR